MDIPRTQARAMTREEWEQFTDEHGHPPTWPPARAAVSCHQGRHSDTGSGVEREPRGQHWPGFHVEQVGAR
mgnify:CR=1 FL=1